jgi:hypothetical protein
MKQIFLILSLTLLYAESLEVTGVDSELLPLNQTMHSTEEASVEKKEEEIKENLQTPKEESLIETQAQKIQKIRESLHIAEPTQREKKIDAIRKELNIEYQVPKNESTLDQSVASIKEKFVGIDLESGISKVKDMVGLGEEKKNTQGFSLSHSLESIGLDIELPSLWGEKPKKKKKSLFGIGFLSDIKETGTSFYKGAKYSGQSAQLMSGMVYKSSKMYNTMFGMFDDSPLNIFQEEEEEPSLFDVFEHGNSILDMLD